MGLSIEHQRSGNHSVWTPGYVNSRRDTGMSMRPAITKGADNAVQGNWGTQFVETPGSPHMKQPEVSGMPWNPAPTSAFENLLAKRIGPNQPAHCGFGRGRGSASQTGM